VRQEPGYWERTVAVTMAGPRYLSLLISDDTDCGGAHPETGVWALVFDLGDGAQVDWRRLLGARLAGKTETDDDPSGLKVILQNSPRLYELYMAHYGRGADDADCRDAMEESPEPPSLALWLEAAKGGLAVKPVVPHVVEACAVAIVIPAATLKAEGAGAEVLRALAEARRPLKH
jgi:hypothetical protein